MPVREPMTANCPTCEAPRALAIDPEASRASPHPRDRPHGRSDRDLSNHLGLEATASATSCTRGRLRRVPVHWRDRRVSRVREVVVAVFGDAHAHAEAFDAVIGAAEACGVQELWSLGDMVGRGPDPEHVVARTRDRCAVALMGNHDYGATGSAELTRFGAPGSPAVRSIELACERLTAGDVEWMRSRRPAARRGEVQ